MLSESKNGYKIIVAKSIDMSTKNDYFVNSIIYYL